MVTKDRRHEQVPKQRTPFRAMLTMSGCLGVLGAGRVGTGTVIGPSPVLPVCYLTSDPPWKMCQWVGTQILRNTWEVCAWQVSEREVSVGCPERSLGEISQTGCVGGPPMETVWVSVWRLLVKAPWLLTVLPLTREGHRDFPLLVSCYSVGVPLCHFAQVSSGSAPPPSALTS